MTTTSEQASEAFDRGELERVRSLLEPLARDGDRDAQTQLGTYLTLRDGTYLEGIEWLRAAADAGHGHAAHNLATALFVGGPGIAADPEAARRYMDIAVASGFEETVSSDPRWWATVIPAGRNRPAR